MQQKSVQKCFCTLFIFWFTKTGLFHLSQRISVFHFSLHHKQDFFRVVFTHFIFLGFLHDIFHYLLQIDVYITVSIGLSIKDSAFRVILIDQIEEII